MYKPILVVALVLTAGCSAVPTDTSEAARQLTAWYDVSGDRDGSLTIHVGQPQPTKDSRLASASATPITIQARDSQGQLMAASVFWVDGGWQTMRVDEYCMGVFDNCTHVWTSFGVVGTPPPFGIAPEALANGRTGWDGQEADLSRIVRQRGQYTLEYGAPGMYGSQLFLTPHGTFTYDRGILPLQFVGNLPPFGAAVASLAEVIEGPVLELGPRWPHEAVASTPSNAGTFFPGDDLDPWRVGVSFADAWRELTKRNPSLNQSLAAGCLAMFGFSRAGDSPGIALGIEASNSTRFDVIRQGDPGMGTRYGTSTYVDWARGRQWIAQPVEQSSSYGRCHDPKTRPAPVVDAHEFMAHTAVLATRGDQVAFGAVYWDDVIQPFGVPHTALRFGISLDSGSPIPYQAEMDATNGRWYRWAGHPADAAKNGALPLAQATA